MSRTPQRIIKGLLRLHFNNATQTFTPKPSKFYNNAHGFSTFSTNSSLNSFKTHFNHALHPSFPIPNCPNVTKFGSLKPFIGRSYTSLSGNAKIGEKRLSLENLVFNPLRIRQFSTKLNAAKISRSGVAKKVVQRPLSFVTSSLSRYREAIGLQIEGFWKRNVLFVVGAAGVVVCIMLWRIMFGIANTFVGLSEGMAKYGFLALSTAIVAFAGLYLRSKYAVNPDKVYRMAMRELNTDARSLEVMGAPLAGTDLRAYVMSGGGLTMTKFKPRLRSKSCFLIFPVRGSERKGLVSVHVKKKKGKYDVKLLAVDVPMASGPDQRLFLVGDEDEYRIGGGLVAELRDPVVRAMAATKELEEIDDIEAEEDEERELQEAERKHQEEVARLQRERAQGSH